MDMETGSTVRSIVLVDDEEDVLFSLERDLRRWTERHKLAVYSTTSAEEALRIVHEEYPATGLVISDLKMPGMNGADLFVALHEGYPDVGCLMVTAYSDLEQMSKAVTSSTLGLVSKPWNPQRLEEDLERALKEVEARRRELGLSAEVQREREIAAAWQRAMMDVQIHDDPRILYGCLSRPATGTALSGDFSLLLRLDADRYVMVAGEVSEEGVPGVLLAGLVRELIHSWAGRWNSGESGPGTLLTCLDRLPQVVPGEAGGGAGGRIPSGVSCVAAVVNCATGELLVANRGMPPAYIVSRGDYTYSQVEGRTCNDEERMQLAAGDRLVLVTDGLFSPPDADNLPVSRTRIGTILQGAHRSASFEENVIRLITADRLLKGQPTVPLFTDAVTISSFLRR